MQTQATIEISLLLDSEHKDLDQLIQALESKGFVLKESLAAIGVLTGTAPSARMHELSAVPGVLSCEINRTDYRI